MYYLLEWISSLFRTENINAIMGSLKRRIFRLNFLEMRISLNNKTINIPSRDGFVIRGYSKYFEDGCISVLNSAGSLGPWNKSRFKREILLSVADMPNDIFIVCDGDTVAGITVFHKKSPVNGLNEIGYVAVRPGYRGKKLGYKLLMHILAEINQRNIACIYLRTDSFRIPAIKTYLKTGFYPYMKNKNECKRWERIMRKIGN